MVVGAFPLAKLGALLLRQASKPIANCLKEEAKTSQFFRTYVCMPPAQFYNWCEVKSKMWILNLGKPVQIPTLNEPMAIELGANLLGEGIIFTIAASLIFFEYNRQSQKEIVKEHTRKKEIVNLHDTISDLVFEVEKQKTQIREVSRLIGDLDSRVVKLPAWAASTVSNKDNHELTENKSQDKEVLNADTTIEATTIKPVPIFETVGPYIIINPEVTFQPSFDDSRESQSNAVRENNDGLIKKAIYLLR